MTMYLVMVGLTAMLGGVMWRLHVSHQVAIEALDDRLAHLTAGLALLTDTTEVGLRDVAQEITRLSGPAPAAAAPRARAVSQRRVATAARRGKSVQQIAASEKMSEGEVRLRLNIDNRPKDRAHAAVR